VNGKSVVVRIRRRIRQKSTFTTRVGRADFTATRGDVSLFYIRTSYCGRKPTRPPSLASHVFVYFRRYRRGGGDTDLRALRTRRVLRAAATRCMSYTSSARTFVLFPISYTRVRALHLFRYLCIPIVYTIYV